MNENFKIINGDNRIELDKLEANSIGACITDPPYELGFMNKGWDKSGIAYDVEMWKKLYRVLKPGAYLLAFGGSRTFHRIACAIEDAGFEVRDVVMYLYGSGFPKSMNISKGIEAREQYGNAGTRAKKQIEQNCDGEEYTIKQTNNGAMGEIIETTRKEYNPKSELAKKWKGYGTCLKPAYEPIIVARKPCEGSCIDNVIKYDVGAINIDECRVGNENISTHNAPKGTFAGGERNRGSDTTSYDNHIGRFPANVIHDGSEEAISGMPNTSPTKKHDGDGEKLDTRKIGFGFKRMPCEIEDDGGSASRYFYCAKASSKDRDEGLELGFEQKKCSMLASNDNIDKDGNFTGMLKGRDTKRFNTHCTVKPCLLMQYLVRLVAPKGETVLDIFNGSGSTGKAVAFENRERNANYKYIGIELNKEYCDISIARINYALDTYTYERKLEKAKTGLEQLDLFDFI